MSTTSEEFRKIAKKQKKNLKENLNPSFTKVKNCFLEVSHFLILLDLVLFSILETGGMHMKELNLLLWINRI